MSNREDEITRLLGGGTWEIAGADGQRAFESEFVPVGKVMLPSELYTQAYLRGQMQLLEASGIETAMLLRGRRVQSKIQVTGGMYMGPDDYPVVDDSRIIVEKLSADKLDEQRGVQTHIVGVLIAGERTPQQIKELLQTSHIGVVGVGSRMNRMTGGRLRDEATVQFFTLDGENELQEISQPELY